MSNAMKYVKDLEAAGFERSQAEAQVQMVLDALEGDLVTKSDFSVFKEHVDSRFSNVDNRFAQMQAHMDNRFSRVDSRFTQFQSQMDLRFMQVNNQIKESELRTVIRLGAINVATISVAVAVLAWLIKV